MKGTIGRLPSRLSARPQFGVAKQRLQPMDDFTDHVVWWLSMDALMIATMVTITCTVVWLAR
jgi:hypothetical protein